LPGCSLCGRTAPDDLPDGVEFLAADIRDADQAKALVDQSWRGTAGSTS
jgi:hypothetical protein